VNDPKAVLGTVILNVDDTDAALYAKSRVLRRAGYTVVEARTGQETLEKLRVHRPDLVILDVHLPDIDGRDICAVIKQDPDFTGTLVLQTSATFVETKDRIRALEYGADMYLVEPVEAAELLAVVAALLRLLETEKALRASERRYRTLATGAPVGIFHTDSRGEWVYANESWRRMAGWQAGTRPPLEWLSAVHPQDRERVASQWQAALRESREFSSEHRLQRPDGTCAYVFVQAQPEINEAGTLVSYVGSVTEITERKRSEEALREADRRKDEFLAMLAHELRNPLQPMSNALQLMRSRRTQDEVMASAREIMERQLLHLARLVDDLLDVSRITRGHIGIRKQPVEVRKVIEDALESVQALVEERRHQLSVELPREPLQVLGDLTRLTQVLLNLLNNAAKYTPEGGRIALSARREGEQVAIRLRDNGPGIAPDLLPRIFDLFTQGVRPLDRNDGGLGIGLTLARRLAALHGGTLGASSAGPGTGSEFVLRLPLHESAPGRAPHEPRGPRNAAPSERILVVDDNPDAADSLKSLLELVGHEACAAYEGPGAIELARSFRPSLVLLDIGLPGMDGYEVAERLRRELADGAPRIVAMTGYGHDADRERSHRAGFAAHLVKPVSLDALQDLLAETNRS
jgi:PAS domain S-box-containing protein